MKSPTGDYAQFYDRPHWTELMFAIGSQPSFRWPKTDRQDKSSDLKDTESRAKPNISGKAGPELRVVGIDFNPGPDAEDRLRRLFTILVKHAARNMGPVSEKGFPPDDFPVEDHAEAEA